MPETIPFGLFIYQLHELFDETFDQVHGRYLDKGTSLVETLETITAEEASRPVGACASVAAQVEHTRFYLDICARYARGEEVGKIDWDATWALTSVTTEEWEALKGRLRATYRELLAVLQAAQTWEHPDAVGGALDALVHTAFHLGQIRQSLCTIER